MTPTEIHNRDAANIIDSIIRPTLEEGHGFLSVLVLLESVVAGVMLFGVKQGGDEAVLDMFVQHVKERLVLMRAEKDGKNN